MYGRKNKGAKRSLCCLINPRLDYGLNNATTPVEPGQLILFRHALKSETDNFFLDMEFINKQGDWVIDC